MVQCFPTVARYGIQSATSQKHRSPLLTILHDFSGVQTNRVLHLKKALSDAIIHYLSELYR